MGISYEDMLNLTWRAFDYYQIGYNRKVERQWDYTRHMISSMYNSSGMSKKQVKPKDIMRLPMLDDSVKKEFKRVPIDRVKELLKVMK